MVLAHITEAAAEKLAFQSPKDLKNLKRMSLKGMNSIRHISRDIMHGEFPLHHDEGGEAHQATEGSDGEPNTPDTPPPPFSGQEPRPGPFGASPKGKGGFSFAEHKKAKEAKMLASLHMRKPHYREKHEAAVKQRQQKEKQAQAQAQAQAQDDEPMARLEEGATELSTAHTLTHQSKAVGEGYELASMNNVELEVEGGSEEEKKLEPPRRSSVDLESAPLPDSPEPVSAVLGERLTTNEGEERGDEQAAALVAAAPATAGMQAQL